MLALGFKGSTGLRRTRLQRLKLLGLMSISALVLIVIAVARTCERSPDLSDTMRLVATIRIAQENCRAETLEYVSASSSPTSWYPSEPQGEVRRFENPSHRDAKAWQNLNVIADAETAFGFVTIAGKAGSRLPASPMTTPLSWPTSGDEPWYVIYATGSVDGQRYLLVTSSLSGEIHVEQIGE